MNKDMNPLVKDGLPLLDRVNIAIAAFPGETPVLLKAGFFARLLYGRKIEKEFNEMRVELHEIAMGNWQAGMMELFKEAEAYSLASMQDGVMTFKVGGTEKTVKVY